MENNLKLYLKLFTSTLSLSAFTFGGGYVIVSLMKKKFVDEEKLIDEEELLNLAAIAQSSPGAVAVNASILLGYRVAGMMGAIITIIGTILPPLIILSVISIFYIAFRDNAVVHAVLKAMQAGVAAVIADVVISMGGTVMKDKKVLPIIVMFGSFIAAYFFNVNVMFIVIICGALGAMMTIYSEKRKKRSM